MMVKYLKNAFSFVHTYIFISILIAVPAIFGIILKPPIYIFIIYGISGLFLLLKFIHGLHKQNAFIEKAVQEDYSKYLNEDKFKKTIASYHMNVKKVLDDFYSEAMNIVKELNLPDINQTVSQALGNVLDLGKNYSILQRSIDKNMGTKEQREEMTAKNNERLALMNSAYHELKALGGKLILDKESGTKDNEFFILKLSSLNELLGTKA